MDQKNVYDIIDGLSVSKGWKNTFKKIQIAYYHNFYQGKANNIHVWTYGQEVANLSADDRFKFFTRFNFFALILGPLYYLAKFMFVKGIILCALEAALIYKFWQSPVMLLAVLFHIYAAIYANTDYFSCKVLNNKEVVENPGILSDSVDRTYMDNIVKGPSLRIPFAIFSVVALGCIGWYIANQFIIDTTYQNTLNHVKRACNSHAECVELAKVSMTNIRQNKEPLAAEYFNLGAAYFELGNMKNSLMALDKASSLDKEYIMPYLLKGIIYTNLNQFQSARANFDRALKIYPNGRRFLYHRYANTYYKEKQFTLAKTYYEKAVKAYPNKPDYREALAYTKIYLGDTQGAKEDLKKVIKLLKKDGELKNPARIERIEAYMNRLK